MATPHEKFQKLENERIELLNTINNLSLSQIHHPPKAGKWSIAQIMEHLRVAEKQVLNALIRRPVNSDSLKKATLLPSLVILLTKLIFNTRIKLKAPKFVANIPEKPDFEYLKTDWNTVRAGFEKFTATFPSEHENKIIFNHPLLGPMTIHHILDFMLAHFQVHRRQILAIIHRKP